MRRTDRPKQPRKLTGKRPRTTRNALTTSASTAITIITTTRPNHTRLLLTEAFWLRLSGLLLSSGRSSRSAYAQLTQTVPSLQGFIRLGIALDHMTKRRYPCFLLPQLNQ